MRFVAKPRSGRTSNSALAGREHVRRQPVERLRELAVLADDPDAAGALADDDPAVGQEVEQNAPVRPSATVSTRERLGLRRRRRARLAEPLRNRRVAVRRGAFSRRLLPRRLRGRTRNSFGLCGHHDSADRHTRGASDEESSNHYRFTGLPNTSIFATLT